MVLMLRKEKDFSVDMDEEKMAFDNLEKLSKNYRSDRERLRL